MAHWQVNKSMKCCTSRISWNSSLWGTEEPPTGRMLIGTTPLQNPPRPCHHSATVSSAGVIGKAIHKMLHVDGHGETIQGDARVSCSQGDTSLAALDYKVTLEGFVRSHLQGGIRP